jgi:WD40 repeat protein
MSADAEGNIMIHDTNEALPINILTQDPATQVWDASWNNMGTILATCGGDRLVKLWSDKKICRPDQDSKINPMN